MILIYLLLSLYWYKLGLSDEYKIIATLVHKHIRNLFFKKYKYRIKPEVESLEK